MIGIGGRTFYASSSRLTKIHNAPLSEAFEATEHHYIHIPARIPGRQPRVYLFLMSDFKLKSEAIDANMKDFISVLESFYPKDELPPV